MQAAAGRARQRAGGRGAGRRRITRRTPRAPCAGAGRAPRRGGRKWRQADCAEALASAPAPWHAAVWAPRCRRGVHEAAGAQAAISALLAPSQQLHSMAERHVAPICALVAKGPDAKRVKNRLKALGMLDTGFKPGVAEGGAMLAFPLVVHCGDDGGGEGRVGECAAATAAVLADAELADLVSRVEAVCDLRHVKAKPSQAEEHKRRVEERKREGAAGVGGDSTSSNRGDANAGGGSVRRVCAPPAVAGGITPDWFAENVAMANVPAVISGLDLLGTGCADAGTFAGDVLSAAELADLAGGSDGDRLVPVHVSAEPSIDLAGHRPRNTSRNFAFVDVPLAEAIERCAGIGGRPPLLAEGEALYLRSVAGKGKNGATAAGGACGGQADGSGDGAGADVRGGDGRSHLAELFPSLARRLRLPRAYPPSAYHSSVLRLSSAGSRLWTHFDTRDNLLIQLTGTKRVALWPPSADAGMYAAGSSARVEDVDAASLAVHPLFHAASAARVDTTLRPGEALYLPALWYHHVSACASCGSPMSAAVNVFWNALPADEYAPGDVFGNRDPCVAAAAVAKARDAARLLKRLPRAHQELYGGRAAAAVASELALPLAPLRALPRTRARRVTLPTGATMPVLALGTWQLPPERAQACVEAALGMGYCHLDCAPIYGNEAQVGAGVAAALHAGVIERHELFVTSKLWNTAHQPEDARPAVERTLAALRCGYLDLLLLHWPVASGKKAPKGEVDIADAEARLVQTWKAMEALVTAGVVRAVGLSNFGPRKLALINAAAVAPVAAVQFEMHPLWRNEEALAACVAAGATPMASMVLGGDGAPAARAAQAAMEDAAGASTAASGTGAALPRPSFAPSAAGACVRWSLARGACAVVKATTVAHLADNLRAAAATGDAPSCPGERERVSASPTLPLLPEPLAATLSSLEPQQRRADGKAFLSSRGPWRTLEELWA